MPDIYLHKHPRLRYWLIFQARDSRTISSKTFEEYADILTDLFIIEDMEAWNPNLRSKTVVRSTPTHHFVDSHSGAGT